ncbi:hypothetical protein A8B75_18180 [Sphingomonadales bacterium EhC05]|nr:hypothetical protein A8B75_18180 [Sphingomonadales bacterium EhC05]
MNRNDLKELIIQAIRDSGGSATIAEVGKYIWEKREKELRKSGEFFYKWQYELRWASNVLVREKRLRKGPPRGMWHA